MLPLIYHDAYDLSLGEHVFPSQKYRLIQEHLGLPVITPESAADTDITLVHTEAWMEGMRDGTLSASQIRRLEIPWTQATARAFWLAAGGTILASRLALEHGGAFNIGGGFHHAFAQHGEGFCAIHDVAVALRKMQQEGLISRAMTVDVDVHHGNGTAAIFRDDDAVFTLSIPSKNPPLNL